MRINRTDNMVGNLKNFKDITKALVKYKKENLFELTERIFFTERHSGNNFIPQKKGNVTLACYFTLQ